MERFDERLVVNEPSGSKFYQVVPCEDGKFVLYADAQATVEALQRERDEQIRERERYFQLWMQATEERNEMRKERDEAQWPNVLAPAMYDNPDPGWKDTQVPDLTRIWGLAREVGYAVGLHGSLKRDMDLIAVPWAEEAVGNAELIDHLCKGLPAVRIGGPEHKPHKRVAVTLQMDGYFKPIDLSIVYRTTTLQAALDDEREKVAKLEAALDAAQGESTRWFRAARLQREAGRDLRALVRAYREAKVAFDDGRLREDHHAWKERFNKLELTEAALIDYTMRTLDATTLYGGEANAANENE